MKLKELTEKRQKHLQSCIDNKDSSHELIAGMYSDPSHFIYELIQNADDANATEIVFKLNSNSLEFSHNGTELFNYKDVESITSVGHSTKLNEINKIGKFGAGFKSVFAVTESPIIHSSNFHFEIKNFIVPYQIDDITENSSTKIILPFNKEGSDKQKIYSFIKGTLLNLEAECLLFLKKISKINWETKSSFGSYYLETEDDFTKRLIKKVKHDLFIDNYLVFSNTIKIGGADNLNLVVAFSLKNNEGDDSPKRITAYHESKLFVFFPTSVNTGLKFLIHAPYKTTPNRETINFNDEENKILTQELSKLVAQSIITLKERGFIDLDFLNLLPLRGDFDHSLYNSIRNEIIALIKEQPLLPTSNGTYASGLESLIATEKELTQLLTRKDTVSLYQRKAWLKTEINSKKYQHLKESIRDYIDCPEISIDYFCENLTHDFLKSKDDSWLTEFYKAVSTKTRLYQVKSYSIGVLRSKPIIKLTTGELVNPTNESGDIQVYLPGKQKSEFKTIKKSLVKDPDALEFFQSLGITEPDKISEIKEFIVPKYWAIDSLPSKKEYQNNFNKVYQIWLGEDDYNKNRITDLIKGLDFIGCYNGENKFCLKKASQVYINKKEIQLWYSGNNIDEYYFIDQNFFDNVHLDFLESLGIMNAIKLNNNTQYRKEWTGYYKRGVTGFNPDFDIEGIEYAIENMNYDRSLILWNICLENVKRLHGHTEFKTNKNKSYEKGELEDSLALKKLRDIFWLYDSKRKKIQRDYSEIVIDDISMDYTKHHENIDRLIKALGFKLDEVSEFEKKTGKKVVSKEDFELLQKLKSQETQNESSESTKWSAIVEPDDVEIQINSNPIKKRITKDRSYQNQEPNINNDSGSNGNQSPEDQPNNVNSDQNKEIGVWGEAVAYNYLKRAYKSSDFEVINLNRESTRGVGYDFVVKKNKIEIAYYEVKTKLDDRPSLFKISKSQWNWAKKLHEEDNGEKYRILVITNAGSNKPGLLEVINPVKRWKLGEIEADPVNLIL